MIGLLLLTEYQLCNAYILNKQVNQNNVVSNQRNNKFIKTTNAFTHERRSNLIVCDSTASSANVAALNALLKLISTCGIGLWASKIGLLDKTALSILSKLIFGLFQPCLLFVNVASTVASSRNNAAMRILPIFAMYVSTPPCHCHQ